MNKSLLVVAVIGVGSCVGMTLIMGQLLSMKRDKQREGSALAAFSARFRGMLERESSITIEHVLPKKGQGVKGVESSKIHVTAVVYPKVTVEIPDMILQMGNVLWKSSFKAGLVQGVTVKWQDPVSGDWQQEATRPPRRMLTGPMRNRYSVRKKRPLRKKAPGKN
ncbi:MAG: hypothetical protein IID41_03865 [Planctomycetes bacterium]|nr:hypothetical protein [Planctomycetota bacterium]